MQVKGPWSKSPQVEVEEWPAPMETRRLGELDWWLAQTKTKRLGELGWWPAQIKTRRLGGLGWGKRDMNWGPRSKTMS